jgi:hypothetical protein
MVDDKRCYDSLRDYVRWSVLYHKHHANCVNLSALVAREHRAYKDAIHGCVDVCLMSSLSSCA